MLLALTFKSSFFKKKSLRSKLVFDKLVEVGSKLELSEEEEEEEEEEEILGYLKIIKF